MFRGLIVKALLINLQKYPQINFFVTELIPKWSALNALLPVILLLLTFRTRSLVWNLKKMPVILMYWFPVQQHTSTNRRQKSHFIYWKFSVEENEITPSVQNSQEVTEKLQKANNTRKNENILVSGTKCYWNGNKSTKISQTKYFCPYLIHGYLQWKRSFSKFSVEENELTPSFQNSQE